jgi:hypothetical protein
VSDGDIESCGCEHEPHTCVEGAPAETQTAQRKKRKASTSPTQRTLAELRKRGWTAQVVERWNPHARVRVDLFGVIDLVAIVPLPPGDELVPPVGGEPSGILGIQACSATDHAQRRDKILAEPRARLWVERGGQLELWSWSKRGGRGARKLWALRVEVFTAASAWAIGCASCKAPIAEPHRQGCDSGGDAQW